MAIQVVCTCGKRLKAPDKLGGKRAKCPGCGQVLVLPMPEGYGQPVAPVALASFGWLVWQIEAAWSLYGDVEEDQAGVLRTA